MWDHIASLKQGITLAKVGVLSPELLDPIELDKITVNQYKFIKSGLFQDTSKNRLYFTVQIPIFSTSIYHNILLEPVPNFGGRQLFTNTSTNNLVIRGIDNQILANPSNEEALLFSPSHCLNNLFTEHKTNCSFVVPDSSSIIQLSSNVIVTKNLQKTTLTHNCINKTPLKVWGNNYFKFSYREQ